MSRKPKFKPVITRVKLDPEQAVLSCSCVTTSTVMGDLLWIGRSTGQSSVCNGGGTRVVSWFGTGQSCHETREAGMLWRWHDNDEVAAS